jgi:hypothetical protein
MRESDLARALKVDAFCARVRPLCNLSFQKLRDDIWPQKWALSIDQVAKATRLLSRIRTFQRGKTSQEILNRKPWTLPHRA